MWNCPKCRAKVDDSFEICWSCGTSRDGEEDPAFARADDVGPAPDPPCKPDPPRGRMTRTLRSRSWLPRSRSWTATGRAIPPRRCSSPVSSCRRASRRPPTPITSRVVFAGFFGLVPAGPYFGPRVRVFAGDLPRARSWLAGYEARRRAKRQCHHN